MSPRTRDEHLFGPGPKRILALDGGGIRGIFTLQILKDIEAIVRQRLGNPAACLADYFDLIGGTSTGSIIAAGLALGWPVDRLDTLYQELGNEIFQPELLRKGVLRAKFSAAPLRRVLEEEFGDITLGDEQIRTGLAIMTKRLDTGSPWILTNNPKARYFEQRPDSNSTPNKDYLLREVVRASTAAPHFFTPEQIAIAPDVEGAFIDGGVSPHNNPALQLLLLATIEGYQLNWPTGADNLLIVSVGTGFKSVKTTPEAVMEMAPAILALQSLQSLMDDALNLNELVLQMVSNSPTARAIDREVGTVTASSIPAWLSYLRYNVELDQQWIKNTLGLTLSEEQVKELQTMDQPSTMDLLIKIGKLTAEKCLKADHFSSSFDLA